MSANRSVRDLLLPLCFGAPSTGHAEKEGKILLGVRIVGSPIFVWQPVVILASQSRLSTQTPKVETCAGRNMFVTGTVSHSGMRTWCFGDQAVVNRNNGGASTARLWRRTFMWHRMLGYIIMFLVTCRFCLENLQSSDVEQIIFFNS
uniref:Uncharacterized protein n=1 Tax=Schistocephalus solidus TaxID=70667 RepID=A0A0X3PLN3_SCHSO